MVTSRNWPQRTCHPALGPTTISRTPRSRAGGLEDDRNAGHIGAFRRFACGQIFERLPTGARDHDNFNLDRREIPLPIVGRSILGHDVPEQAAIRSCREATQTRSSFRHRKNCSRKSQRSVTSRSPPRNHVFLGRLSRIRKISEHFGRVSSRLRRTARTMTSA
jgi:hypothetical protein